MLYTCFRSILRVFYRTYFKFEAIGLENIPIEGPVILCSNHKSNWDPPTVATFLERKVRFMAKEELFRIPLFGPLIRTLGAFPVRRGGISKESVRLTLRILGEGEVLLIFPEGSRRASDGAGKRGAATFALKANATVIPIAIVGSYKFRGKLKVVYGQPMNFVSDERLTTEEATKQIMQRIRSMEDVAV